MKRLALSFVLMCVVALPAMGSINLNSSRSNIYKIVQEGPGGPLKCMAVPQARGKDMVACTQDEVKALAASLGTSKSIKSLAVRADGSLLCNGTPCTTAHLTELDKAAHSVNMRKSGGDPTSSTTKQP